MANGSSGPMMPFATTAASTAVARINASLVITRRIRPVRKSTSAILTRQAASGPSKVLSRATDPADYLQAMSQRFCGDVIDATGPDGWTVTVKRERGLRDLAGEVTWESPASAKTGQATARRISDFSVTLQGKWRTGLGHYVAFTSGGPNANSPHDCPYTDR
jgi:hypothetical protein